MTTRLCVFVVVVVVVVVVVGGGGAVVSFNERKTEKSVKFISHIRISADHTPLDNVLSYVLGYCD